VASAFGVTFSTALRWSLDGDGLAVQSCGLVACRTRVLELAGGAIETFADESQGQIIGLTAGKLVTFDACPDLPVRPGGHRPARAGRGLTSTWTPTPPRWAEDAQGPVITVSPRRRNEGDPAMKRARFGAMTSLLLIAGWPRRPHSPHP
jgi:hypothetical protein